jgi:hypothetical protein
LTVDQKAWGRRADVRRGQRLGREVVMAPGIVADASRLEQLERTLDML